MKIFRLLLICVFVLSGCTIKSEQKNEVIVLVLEPVTKEHVKLTNIIAHNTVLKERSSVVKRINFIVFNGDDTIGRTIEVDNFTLFKGDHRRLLEVGRNISTSDDSTLKALKRGVAYVNQANEVDKVRIILINSGSDVQSNIAEIGIIGNELAKSSEQIKHICILNDQLLDVQDRLAEALKGLSNKLLIRNVSQDSLNQCLNIK